MGCKFKTKTMEQKNLPSLTLFGIAHQKFIKELFLLMQITL